MPVLNVNHSLQSSATSPQRCRAAASAYPRLLDGLRPQGDCEGEAGAALWLQGLILQVLLSTRAATSSGADVDSFIADLDSTKARQRAQRRFGGISRGSPSSPLDSVPVGGTVRDA